MSLTRLIVPETLEKHLRKLSMPLFGRKTKPPQEPTTPVTPNVIQIQSMDVHMEELHLEAPSLKTIQNPPQEDEVLMTSLPFDEWLEIAKKKFAERINSPALSNAKLSDFDLLNTVGTGSFGRVLLVQHKQTKKYHAMKVLEKHKVVKLKQIPHSLNEKKILSGIKFPFLARLDYHFKDNANLFMVLEFIPGGEMFSHLRRMRKFPEAHSRFYAAQIILAFEYLHSLNVIYRDLKPENILFDQDGYVKLTDFGFAKQVNGRTYTTCGTPEYLAPEIFLSQGHNHAVDWWALGILMFEMCAGYTPFCAETLSEIHDKIAMGRVDYPRRFSPDLVDIIKNLLQVDRTKRYGNLKNGVADIKDHSFFFEVRWDPLFHKQIPPPFYPRCRGEGDTGNFDLYRHEDLSYSPSPRFIKEFAAF